MTQFKKGVSGNPKGKPKGTVSEKVKFWDELKGFMVNEGAEKYKSELMKLNGPSFIMAYTNALEYFQPKLNRTTLEGDKENPITIQTQVEILGEIVDKINKNAAS